VRRYWDTAFGVDRRLWLPMVPAVVAVVYVLVAASSLFQFIATLAVIYAIAALALDLVLSRAGQVSVGSAAFFGIGAFVTAIVSEQSWGLLPVALLASALLGGLIGAVIGIPSLRLSGFYLALATLALQYIVAFGGNELQSRTGHIGGFEVVGRPLLGVNVTSGRALLILSIVLLGITAWIVHNLYRRLPGRMWTAIRENEVAASTMGVSSIRWKLGAFVISSALTALAGGLYAYYVETVTSDPFTLDLAVAFIIMVIVGGARTIYGPIVGAVLVVELPHWLTSLSGSVGLSNSIWWTNNSAFIVNSLYGFAVLLILLLYPKGVVPGVSKLVLRATQLVAKSRQKRGQRPKSEVAIRAEDPSRILQPSAENGIAASQLVLTVRDLRVKYSNGANALAGLSLMVQRDAVVAVVGRNGAGKTTLLRSISGFLPAEKVVSSGHIAFNGAEVRGLSPVQTAKMGILLVPERDKVFPNLTIGEHFQSIGDPEIAESLLPDAWGVLKQRWRARAGTLSGGERQLMAILLAASLKPKLLLIDEMSLGLAPVARRRVGEAICQLRDASEMSVLIVEQDVATAHMVANEVLMLRDGELEAFDADAMLKVEVSEGILARRKGSSPSGSIL